MARFFQAQFHLTPLLVFLLAAMPELRAQDREREKERSTAPVPPMAMPQTVEVTRGGSVEINLSSQGRRGETVSFLVRTPPRHGTLTEPMRVDRWSGVVRYRHSGQPDHAEDSFTFATQSPGTAVSAPARITIRVIDPPPQLVAPKVLAFGPTAVGKSERKSLTVKNIGGLPMTARLDVLTPWSLAAGFPAEYTLAAGASVDIPLIFSPTAPGESSSVLKFGRDRPELTLLRGEATAPFSLAPSTLTLREDPTRPGAPLTVTNSSDGPITVKLAWSEGFTGPTELTLAAGEKHVVMAELAGPSPLELTGTARVSLGALTLPVKLHALPLPARLEAPEAVEFGRITNAAETMRKLVLRNTGGMPLVLDVRREGDFVIPGLNAMVGIDAGAAKELEIYPPQTGAGAWVGRLHLSAGGLDYAIKISGENVPAGQTAPPTVANAPAPEPRQVTGTRVTPTAPSAASSTESPPEAEPPGKRTPTPEQIAQEDEAQFGPHINDFLRDAKLTPTITGIKKEAVTPTTATISWPKAETPADRIAVQQSVLGLDAQRQLQPSWTAPAQAAVERGLDRDTVKIIGLTPGRTQTLRLVALPYAGADPTKGEPLSRPIHVKTLPEPPKIWERPWVQSAAMWVVLIGAIGSLAWFRFVKPMLS